MRDETGDRRGRLGRGVSKSSAGRESISIASGSSNMAFGPRLKANVDTKGRDALSELLQYR